MRRLSRGISEAVAVVIAFAILSVAMLYLLTNLLLVPVAEQKAVELPLGYSDESLVLFVAGGNLMVKNVGSVPVHIKYIVAINMSSNSKVLLNSLRSTQCNFNASNAVINPGGTAAITCASGYAPLAVVTERGRVFSIDPRFYAIAIGRSYGIPMTTVYGGIMFTSSSGLLKFLGLKNKTMMYSGAVNTSIKMDLYLNTSGNINANLNAALILIGLNPANNKLNMLIIGSGSLGSGQQITVNSGSVDLSKVAMYRYRLKIENFSGTISPNLGPGIYPCYINFSRGCQLTINGRADRIVLYTNSSKITGGIVGLDPYIFVGDLNKNGNVEVVFVTQDFSTGNSNSVNDVLTVSGRRQTYVDATVKPVRLVFSGTPIDSSRYRMAILSLGMFFWDNSEDDVQDNDNRVIMRVGLYDAVNKSFVYSTYLSYYELNRYRNVKPFSISYITKDFMIYVPNTGRTYYVAVEIADPYNVEGARNDADIILGLEYIGIALSVYSG
ncbi:MAG: hypothetical protein QXH86_07525 [Ignisphaera sp.]